MPYRIDLTNPPPAAFDTLVDLGALDVEQTPVGLAALLPDALPPAAVVQALGVPGIRVSAALARDDDSVWLLRPRPVQVGRLLIVRDGDAIEPQALRIADGPAFGTGLHPTTAMCLEIIDELIEACGPRRLLDVGTGSGILALAALHHGVQEAVALDLDPGSLRAAGDNARLNGVGGRLRRVCGGPAALRGTWPLVVANIRAAELVEMAPLLVRLVESRGRLVLSGIPRTLAEDVAGSYRRLGMTHAGGRASEHWSAVMLQASW